MRLKEKGAFLPYDLEMAAKSGVTHLGDEPYTFGLAGVGSTKNYPSQETIDNRRRSVRDAISAYFPEEDFYQYVKHFIINSPAANLAYNPHFTRALQNLSAHWNKSGITTFEQFYKLKKNDARSILLHSGFAREQGFLHAEIMLTLVLLQTAQLSYIDHLAKAVEKILPEHPIDEQPIAEREVAKRVFNQTFSPFRKNITYGTLLNLIYCNFIETNDMDTSVHRAVTQMNERQLFKSTFLEGTANEVKQTCPAHAHLTHFWNHPFTFEDSEEERKESAGAGIISVYYYVHAHPTEFKKLADKMKDTLVWIR